MITVFEALDLNNEIYVIRDFNINLLFRGKYVLNKPNEIKKIDKDLFPEIKRYKEFCSMYGLSQLIDCPTRISCNTSMQVNGLMEKLQRKYTHETNSTKNLK